MPKIDIMALIPTETPEETFTERVKPPYDAYMSDPGCEWKAGAAAYGVGHFPEWIFQYYKHHDPSRIHKISKIKDFRDSLFKQCPELEVVFDVAEANKHRFLEHRPRTVRGATEAFLAGERLMLPGGRFFDEVLRRAYDFLRRWAGL